MPGGGCSGPQIPMEERTVFQTRQFSKFCPAIAKANIDMITAAMACDLTRVALLQIGVTTSAISASWMGISDHMHYVSHNLNSEMSRYTAETIKIGFAYLLQKFKAQTEGGCTLLNNTAAVWANEFMDGDAHQGSPIPFIAAGQAGGKWQTGRFIQFGRVRRNTDFLVTLCRTFGYDITKFGTDQTAGPISELGV